MLQGTEVNVLRFRSLQEFTVSKFASVISDILE